MRVIIYIYSLEPTVVSWVIIDKDNHIQETVIRGDIKELENKTNQSVVYVIIPGEEVLLTQAELPSLSNEKALRVISYAVEDKLIDDIEKLHFSIGPKVNALTPVAIISHQKIQSYLNALLSWGITPQMMFPATLALPWIHDTWSIYCNDSISTVRLSAFEGFACDTSNLSLLLESQWLKSLNKPEKIDIENNSLVSVPFSGGPVKEVFFDEKHSLENIAIFLEKNPYINLLEGNYRSKKTSIESKKIWKWAGISAAAWFFTVLCSQFISLFMLYQANHHYEKQIQLIYYHQFPTATDLIAPRERMESALKKASSAQTNDFLILLGLLSKGLLNTPEVHLQAMNYQDNRLTITTSAISFDALDNLMRSLQKDGLQVKQQNAVTANAEVKANMVLSRGKSNL
jgi:general secretion pathway protein L